MLQILVLTRFPDANRCPLRSKTLQSPGGTAVEHLTITANGADFHLVRAGSGKPLLLLHGWPEFWLTWEPVISRLSDRFMLIAPDLRGFGDSDKPDGPYGPDGHAADMLALMDGLGIDRFAVVGHDVGGAVMQPLARQAGERLAGLFFFDFVYPGIGPRMAAPDRLNHIWYQSFHQMEMAPALVGASRESCRLYIGHSSKVGRIGRTRSTMFSMPSPTISLGKATSPAALRIIAPRMPGGSR
ncbi:pimeloyl-ACP methyl ester carboxylesterase [Bradyrhizobium barranii subsp. barranii]